MNAVDDLPVEVLRSPVRVEVKEVQHQGYPFLVARWTVLGLGRLHRPWSGDYAEVKS